MWGTFYRTYTTTQEFPLWPNFLWNSERAQEFPLWCIFFGTYTKTWVSSSSSMTQFSMELTQNTRVSIMMAFSLELIQKHEFLLLLWPNFIWNLHSTRVSLHATFSLELTQHNLFDYFWRFNTFLCNLFIYKISRFLKIMLLMLKMPR